MIGVLVLVGNMGCMLWGAYEFLLAMDWQRIMAAVRALGRSLQALTAAVSRWLQSQGAALSRYAQGSM